MMTIGEVWQKCAVAFLFPYVPIGNKSKAIDVDMTFLGKFLTSQNQDQLAT
jgi:hypothetical protein